MTEGGDKTLDVELYSAMITPVNGRYPLNLLIAELGIPTPVRNPAKPTYAAAERFFTTEMYPRTIQSFIDIANRRPEIKQALAGLSQMAQLRYQLVIDQPQPVTLQPPIPFPTFVPQPTEQELARPPMVIAIRPDLRVFEVLLTPPDAVEAEFLGALDARVNGQRLADVLQLMISPGAAPIAEGDTADLARRFRRGDGMRVTVGILVGIINTKPEYRVAIGRLSQPAQARFGINIVHIVPPVQVGPNGQPIQQPTIQPTVRPTFFRPTYYGQPPVPKPTAPQPPTTAKAPYPTLQFPPGL
jgi:hypothetical protein